MRIVSRLFPAFAIFGFSVITAPVHVSAQNLSAVQVGIAGLNNNTIHSYVSRDVGFFRKYGIDARLVVFQAGSLLAQASMDRAPLGRQRFQSIVPRLRHRALLAGANRSAVAATGKIANPTDRSISVTNQSHHATSATLTLNG